MPVGPLAVLDETSLSLSVHVMEQTRADLAAEGKHATSSRPGEQLIERMVKELKRPGRAGGGGFYDYPQGGSKCLWPELQDAVREAAASTRGHRGAEGRASSTARRSRPRAAWTRAC